MHSSNPTSARGVRRRTWLLGAVLALAAGLRFWGLGFGLPYLGARPDESEIVGRALRLLTGDLDPHFFHYPSLYFYMIGSVFAAWAGGAAVAGHPLLDTLRTAAVDPSTFFLLARVVTALTGVAGVAALYALGRAFGGTAVGLAAALFLSVAPLHARDSHFATTDVPLALFLTLAMLFVLRGYRRGRWQDFAAAGAFAGLSLSTKYVGLLVPGAAAVAYLLRLAHAGVEWRSAQTARLVLQDPAPWAFAGAMLVAFGATSPYALLDWSLFTSQFAFQLGHLSGGQGLDLGIGGWYHLRHTLPLGVGWPVFALGAIGVGLALRENWRETVVVLSFPLLFYASTFTSRTLFLRYMMPLLPFVCLFAAKAVAAALARRSQTWRVAAWSVLVLLLLLPLSRVVATDRLLGRTDSRLLAADWLVADAGDQAKTVYQSGERWGHLELPATSASLEAKVALVRTPSAEPRLQRMRDYALLQAEAQAAYARARGGGFEAMQLAAVEQGARPDYIVILESGLSLYGTVSSLVRRVVADEYREVHTTLGVPAQGRGWYDQHDAFYLPFAGFDGVERPGPTVRVYRRVSEARRLDARVPTGS